MRKFMSSHTIPAGAMKPDQLNQMADVASKDPVVKPCRSFFNLTDGKCFCVMEAPSKEALAGWFQKMNMPCDYIVPMELEGERGTIKAA